jgi:hypothetical protein
VYLFYVDESGNAQMNAASVAAYPWFTLGAVGIPDRQWWAINTELTALKERYFPGVSARDVEIKSIALRSWGTPRARWPWTLLNSDQAHALADKLYAVYAHYGLSLFAVSVDKAVHRKLGPSPAHPYEIAFAALLQSINRFLVGCDEIGLCFLDEFKGVDRQVISEYTWRRRAGGKAAQTVERIIERPALVTSHDTQMISLADILAYNVYRRFRENDPTYSYFVRLQPQLVAVLRLPENEEPPTGGGSR